MSGTGRAIAIVGRLGVYPMVRLSLPARRILAYLAVRGDAVARQVASAELWPDALEDVGRANLRRALWNAPPGWIAARADELVLQADTDLARAELVAARAIGGEALTFEEIKLLSNDILPGWHEEWLLPDQERFRMVRVQALEAACRTMTGSGQYSLAAQAGAAALMAEPLRESAAEALIDAHLAQRNRYEALRCYRSLAQRLEAELGVLPDPTLAERLAGRAAAARH
jgi:DNA-binding SARP family transcriptional activator